VIYLAVHHIFVTSKVRFLYGVFDNCDREGIRTGEHVNMNVNLGGHGV
jgi:hypothetical protein